ncbi:hypothetical protein HYV70_02905 [Candidatus Uhrbacteria bacterium]|nr:hypothetical protein [Candidatus Uhrbacteria bacterium]
MIKGLRTKMLNLFSDILQQLGISLVTSDGKKFRRYRLVHQGWIWFIFPRLVLESLDDIDLESVTHGTIEETKNSLRELSTVSQTEMREAIKRSAANRATRTRTDFQKKMAALLEGSEDLPSLVSQKGRSAIQKVQRALIEAIGKVTKERFEKIVTKTLAQILIYAREEVGKGSSQQTYALPYGTRFYYEGDPVSLYVIEEAPRVRTIIWNGQRVTVSFPYVIFCLYLNNSHNTFNQLQVFFRNEPLIKPTDDLFLPPLPDIMEQRDRQKGPLNEYYVCFPGPKEMRGTPAQVATSAQHVFWGSSFEPTHWRSPFREQINTMKDFALSEWVERSQKEPGYILKVGWVKVPYNVATFASALKQSKDTFNARESLSRLEKYAQEVSKKLIEGVQEGILDCVANMPDYTQSRTEFDRQLKEVLKESKLEEEVKTLVEAELTQACSDAKIEDLLKGVTQRCIEKFSEIMKPAAQELTVSITRALSHETTKSDEGEKE